MTSAWHIAAVAAVFATSMPASTAGGGPAIEASGQELRFNWGDGQSMSMSEIASRLDACATKAELAAARQVSRGTDDFTGAAGTTIPVGKMDAADALRLTFSVAECSSSAATGFSALVTGNANCGTDGGCVDVFVTTAHPENFGDLAVGGGYQFGSVKLAGGSFAVIVKASGFDGQGCSKGRWTLAASSNIGTLDMADKEAARARFVAGSTTLHLAATRVGVDNEIADTVLPRLKLTEENARLAKSKTDTNGDKLEAEGAAVKANTEGIKTLGEDVELLEGEIRAVATDVTKLPKHCDHLDGVWQNGVVRGAPIAGGTLSFTCASGHWLSGAAKVKCDGETGKYSPAVPTCKPCAKGCLQCTGAGLTQGDCQVCDAKARYYRDSDAAPCTFQQCNTGDPAQNNLLLGQPPKATSSCHANNIIGVKTATDGRYQVIDTSQVERKYKQGHFYHSCSNRDDGELEVALQSTAKVVTVRVFNRCDCCSARITGARVMAQDARSGGWVQCGEPLGNTQELAEMNTQKDRYGRPMCNQTVAPNLQFLERKCGEGVTATALKLVQDADAHNKPDGSTLNIVEFEAYSC